MSCERGSKEEKLLGRERKVNKQMRINICKKLQYHVFLHVTVAFCKINH
jgi:hypothetical protein